MFQYGRHLAQRLPDIQTEHASDAAIGGTQNTPLRAARHRIGLHTAQMPQQSKGTPIFQQVDQFIRMLSVAAG